MGVRDEFADSTLSFGHVLKLSDRVVTSVESGDLPLDRAISSYEKGTGLIQHLRDLLLRATEKLCVLSNAE